MDKRLRDRGVLPVLIPLAVLGGIALLTYSFAQILLTVPRLVAIAVATMAAFSILVTFSVIATRPRLGSGDVLFMLGAAAVPLVIGGAVSMGVIEVTGDDGHGKPQPSVVALVAENVAFDKNEVTVPAGEGFVIDFNNLDTAPHNVAIFQGDSPSAPNVFRGEVFPGPAERRYQVPALEAGSYYFHCDVHPNMVGTMTAQEGAGSEEAHGEEPGEGEEQEGAGGPQPAAPAEEEVVAESIQFLQRSLSFPSGMPLEIVFENKDTVPHNISIFKGSSASGERVFQGRIFGGPRTETYEIEPLETGSYFFHCDVHPNMTGNIKVG